MGYGLYWLFGVSVNYSTFDLCVCHLGLVLKCVAHECLLLVILLFLFFVWSFRLVGLYTIVIQVSFHPE